MTHTSYYDLTKSCAIIVLLVCCSLVGTALLKIAMPERFVSAYAYAMKQQKISSKNTGSGTIGNAVWDESDVLSQQHQAIKSLLYIMPWAVTFSLYLIFFNKRKSS